MQAGRQTPSSLHVGSTPASAQDSASLQLDAINTALCQHNGLVLLSAQCSTAQQEPSTVSHAEAHRILHQLCMATVLPKTAVSTIAHSPAAHPTACTALKRNCCVLSDLVIEAPEAVADAQDVALRHTIVCQLVHKTLQQHHAATQDDITLAPAYGYGKTSVSI